MENVNEDSTTVNSQSVNTSDQGKEPPAVLGPQGFKVQKSFLVAVEHRVHGGLGELSVNLLQMRAEPVFSIFQFYVVRSGSYA